MKKTIRVLIADDEASVLESVKGILVLAEEEDFYVDTVREADKVVEKVRQWRPHVVLLDDRFGEKKVGIDVLLPKIRGEFEEVGIVVITAHRAHEVYPISRASAFGIDGFLDKPFGRDQLMTAVLAAYRAYLDRGGRDD